MLKRILFNLAPELTGSLSIRELLPSLELLGIRYIFTNEFTTTTLSPNECLIITDSFSGTLAAKNAGIPCIGYAPAGCTEDFSLAYSLLESFDGADAGYLCRTHAHALGYPAEILSTKRLIIREFSDADFPALYSLCTEPSASRYMTETLSDYKTEQEKHTAYIHNVYPFSDLALWGIFEKTSGHLIGRAGFSFPEDDNETFSLGYLINSAYRRNGYATECIRALLTYAKELGYSGISAKIKTDNIISQRTIVKCGYSYRQKENPVTGTVTYLISLE